MVEDDFDPDMVREQLVATIERDRHEELGFPGTDFSDRDLDKKLLTDEQILGLPIYQQEQAFYERDLSLARLGLSDMKEYLEQQEVYNQ